MNTNPDPNKTIIGAPAVDPNKTMLGGPGPGFDPNRTQAVAIPSVTPGDSIQVRVIAGREATMANGPARETFLLEVESPRDAFSPVSGQRAPLNLCLVLDRSGSMEGAPLEFAKQACRYVVDLLGPNDVLSIVTFEEIVEVLMSPQRVTNREAIKEGISRITPGNTTNLYDAISVGLNQIQSQSEGGRVARMVVLSDGDPTAGIKDFGSLTEHAGRIREQGISITFLGFGPDYNEELLAAMAKRASGNYAYVPRPELIPEVFRLEVDRMLSTAATNVRLDLKTARWVQFMGLPGQPNTADGSEHQFPLSDLEHGQLIQTVLTFDLANHPLGHYRIAEGKLTFEEAASGRQQVIPIDFVMEFTSDAARFGAPIDPRVDQAAETSALSRAVEKTMMGLKTGQFSAAVAMGELQKTQAILLQQGRTGEAQEVTMALRALQTGDTGSAQKTLMGTVVSLDQGKKDSGT